MRGPCPFDGDDVGRTSGDGQRPHTLSVPTKKPVAQVMPRHKRRRTRVECEVTDNTAWTSNQCRRPSDSRLRATAPRPTPEQGEAVLAVVTAPLFSPDHKLVLPEGTRLTGTVAMAKRARSFHRAGQLRFNFQKLDLPPEVANLRLAVPPAGSVNTQATLLAAEASGTAPIKVDPEGGVKAQESKTRFIAPVISAVLASRAADNERHYDHDGDANDITGKANSNISGRTLGGGLGFGLLWSALSQSSKYVGMAFGYYGLAWSVYSNVIARGGDVEFKENAMMDITFGARTPPKGSKVRAVMQQSAGL